jgi:hypothetical protein
MELQVIAYAITAFSAVSALALYVIRTEMRGDVTRLDGRINSHEASCTQRQRQLDERHAEANAHRAETNVRLGSIDAKLDRLLESR